MYRNSDKKFLLCFHDLNVNNFREVSLKIRIIADVARHPFSLAVVPYLTSADDDLKKEFVQTLKDLQSSGFELLLHGSEHLADTSLQRSFFGLFALKLTNNEAEFAGILENDSAKLLDSAIAFWYSLGLDSPECFVPPAWYGNSFLKSQVLSLMKIYESRSRLFFKRDDRVSSVQSSALSFAGIPSWMKRIAVMYSKTVLELPFGVPRLVFHPIDFEFLGEEKVLELVRYACSLRQIVRYDSL